MNRVYVVYHDAEFSSNHPPTSYTPEHRAPLDMEDSEISLLKQITDSAGRLCRPAGTDQQKGKTPYGAPYDDLFDKIGNAMVAHRFERGQRRWDGFIEEMFGNGVTFDRVEFAGAGGEHHSE